MSTYAISKSSLLSLKAEILRKQQELVKAKVDNEVKIKIIKKNTPLEIKNKGIEDRQKNDITEEEQDLLKQSRFILEAKSKLYDKLSSGKLTEEEKEQNKRFLVRFDKKNKSGAGDCPPSDDDEHDHKEFPESEDDCFNSDGDDLCEPGDKWVDYVDCFGRTRKCMQKDLEYLKSKDEELQEAVEANKQKEDLKPEPEPAQDETNNEDDVDTDKSRDQDKKITKESELLSSDMSRELLRQQWEKEEEELRNKSNIHYQDILFGEARTHGVGYYGFSKDEEERAKQQDALRKLREETEQKQKKAQDLKAMREKQLAARIKAAKNRKRIRLGLPPEEDEPEPEPKPEIPEEKNLIDIEKNNLRQQEEAILERARKNHVRPWDIGKEGVKEHFEMTQEEWVDKKRTERPDEFAPPSTYRKDFRSKVNNVVLDESYKSLKFTTKKPRSKYNRIDPNQIPRTPLNRQNDYLRNKNKTKMNQIEIESETQKWQYESPILKQNEDSIHDSNNKFYFEDRAGSIPLQSDSMDFEKIQQSVSIEPTEIVNLCEETDFSDRLLDEYNKIMSNVNKKGVDDSSSNTTSDSDDDRNRGKGVEIAPPPTFDYYGPGSSKRPRSIPVKSNIHDSIEAGLKFLRKQVEEKEKSTKHPREMYLS